jgi:ketosteroid isomerase-like protein
LYAEDAISQTNMMPTASGRAAIVEQLKGLFSQNNVRIDITPDETHTLGNDGWERGHYAMTMTPRAGGSPMNMEGRYMIVLAKGADGNWRLTRDMDNTATPPAPPAEPAK